MSYTEHVRPLRSGFYTYTMTGYRMFIDTPTQRAFYVLGDVKQLSGLPFNDYWHRFYLDGILIPDISEEFFIDEGL